MEQRERQYLVTSERYSHEAVRATKAEIEKTVFDVFGYLVAIEEQDDGLYDDCGRIAVRLYWSDRGGWVTAPEDEEGRA